MNISLDLMSLLEYEFSSNDATFILAVWAMK